MMIPVGKSCKDIVIIPPATAGEYSLLLKVRDPSRDGLQVVCRVPKGTQYTYHYPTTGKTWDFIVTHSFLGVATLGDTLPNIVKSGMVLTDAGLAFGDADTLSRWINPTKNAWDDFDWIRYACQTAENEEEAITLLTTEAIDQLHATGVSENLFLVGPKRAVVIEGDAIRYMIKNVSEVLVMSNYAKDLWKTQLLRSLPIALSFDTEKETWVRRGAIVQLGSLCGVKVIRMTSDTIIARLVPSFVFHRAGLDKETTIRLGERATVGPYSVILLEINGNIAKLSVCTSEFAWERKLEERIKPSIGNITIEDMIRWSRFHSTDLDDLRAMCENQSQYEAAMVFKIPKEHANLLSSSWFAANHPCSSIYIPIHICDNDFYDPYETGEAASLSLALLRQYGHGNLIPLCQSVEHVFFSENEINELFANQMLHNGINITSFLTSVDKGMQQQAFLTQQLWLNMSIALREIIETLWIDNYSMSFNKMQEAIHTLKNIGEQNTSIYTIGTICLSICKSRIETATFLGRNCAAIEREYTLAEEYFNSGECTLGFIILHHAFDSCNALLKNITEI